MLLLLLVGCVSSSPSDSGDAGDTDTGDTDTAVDTSETVCSDGITGTVEGGFSGDGQFLLLRADYGGWSDGCYGGRINLPHEAVAGAFDWPAEFYAGAGSPEPRAIRAVGCAAAAGQIELSILEEDGTVIWGPWRMTPDPTVEDIMTCD